MHRSEQRSAAKKVIEKYTFIEGAIDFVVPKMSFAANLANDINGDPKLTYIIEEIGRCYEAENSVIRSVAEDFKKSDADMVMGNIITAGRAAENAFTGGLLSLVFPPAALIYAGKHFMETSVEKSMQGEKIIDAFEKKIFGI